MIKLQCVSNSMLLKIFITSILFILPSGSAFAWNINDLFKSMSTNITPPNNYRDQAAGYYSGGGFAMRTKSGSFQPFSLTAPSFKAGCGGIDMYMGSFSMISSDQLVNLARNLGANAASYGFQLGLKTFAPQIENLLKDLRNLAMELNQFAVEDCQAIQSLYSGVLARDSAMYESVCQDLSRTGASRDYFSARKHCADNTKAREEARRLQQGQNNEVLLDNFNLFMIAAKKANIPEDFREGMMSIAGTLIVKDGKRTFKDSLITDEDSFNAFIKGGKASFYDCDNINTCLNVTKNSNYQISEANSYQGRANRKITQLKSKMLTNREFSQADIDFLSSIGESFPIYNYLSLEVISGFSIVDKSSDLVATYMTLHYLGSIISEVREAINVLEGRQLNDQHFKEYLEKLDRVQDILHNKYKMLMQVAYQLQKNARYIEDHHIAKIR